MNRKQIRIKTKHVLISPSLKEIDFTDNELVFAMIKLESEPEQFNDGHYWVENFFFEFLNTKRPAKLPEYETHLSRVEGNTIVNNKIYLYASEFEHYLNIIRSAKSLDIYIDTDELFGDEISHFAIRGVYD